MINPLVSVILPVYNAELYIRDSIKSILTQTFFDFELIIVNDGSTDNTEEIILSFKDNRIRYYKNANNLKLIETLNFGLNLAKGKYIARIDADDISFSDRLEIQVHFLENHPEYGIIGSFAETFGKKKEVIRYVEDDVDIRYALITHNPFIHSSVMLRRSILSYYNLKYNQEQLHVEDYDMWIRILHHSKGKILPVILIRYRLHSEQLSEIHSTLQLMNSNKIQSSYLKDLGFNMDEIEIVLTLLNNCLLNVSHLLGLMDKINELSLKLPFPEKRDQFLETLLKKIINQLQEKKHITFKEFLYLLKQKNIFSLKQKCMFIFKVFNDEQNK